MNDYAIQTDGLTKSYGRGILAVDELSMKVRRGEVYGFVGPNGAGKTTTMRMLLGLMRPTSGRCELLGKSPGTPEALARVGALVETPAFYPYLSGRDNLKVLARHAGVPDTRIIPVLEEVELAGRGDDRYRTYSLGMKQRLGMAAALLKDPELLILDEPTNGLDPAGMAEMRRLIRRLGSGERTVLLSSHLMGELEQICDRVGVVKNGRLVTEASLDELRRGAMIRLRAAPAVRARELLMSIDWIAGVESTETAEADASAPIEAADDIAGIDRIDEGTLMIDADPALAAEINEQLVAAGIRVSELGTVKMSLESVFLNLTEEAADHE
ncbi:MAG: ABC transporter ATP-binding protein [Thermoleophilia bacterium]